MQGTERALLQQRLTTARWRIVGLVGLSAVIIFYYHTQYTVVSTELNMLRVSYNKCDNQLNIKDEKCKKEATQLHKHYDKRLQSKENDHWKYIRRLNEDFNKERQEWLERLRNLSEHCGNDKQELQRQISTFEERIRLQDEHALQQVQDTDKVIKEKQEREDVLIKNVTDVRIDFEKCKKDLENVMEKHAICEKKLEKTWF